MAAALGGFLPSVCAMLMAIAVASAASSEASSSVVVGLAKCADCTRKNMKAEVAFKGLQVAIKCKNSNGEYESKAVGELQSSGAFSIPLRTDDLRGADCLAQLHSAAGAPCPGQEPSRIAPQSEGTSNFVVIPGKTSHPSAECASATLCGPIKKHFLDHFHKKPVPPKPKPEPKPEYHPPTPTYGSPTPTYGSPTPIYHPPARQLFGKLKHLLDHFHKGHEHHHFLDHFHKKPVPPKPKPEPKPQPEYHPTPTPTYGSPTPIYHPPAAEKKFDKKHFLDHFHKGHDHHDFLDHFHKKPVPPKPKPQPQPEYHPTPTPTPTYTSPTPIYHPPAKH